MGFADYLAVVASILLLIVFVFLLYVLYDLLQSIPDAKSDPYRKATEALYDIKKNLIHVHSDSQNNKNIQIVMAALENQTIASKVHKILYNSSFYDSFAYGIAVRSSFCKVDIHREIVNNMAKILIKMVNESSYTYACNTNFIRDYIPSCFSEDDNLNTIFELVHVMARSNCQAEVVGELIEVAKKTELLNLKMEIFKVISKLDSKENRKLCQVAEHVSEFIDDFDEAQKAEFCQISKINKCQILEDPNIVDNCKSIEKEL
ncbi:hypothetical protein TRFO_10507 [Tritrichomonas foetus]|uniref:Uncharacterized protein n=1 Tax=Tritrichomonas foetus TaxID=1144522 RepID=A0A1J4J8B0_9EUKA|nr:hypothetical protein TRFO_10507 [Tritrichomonas foetus]|eukprot:OHS95376.1 hypothetical protein TRFO_10507 [Tritrichomonas foetus]